MVRSFGAFDAVDPRFARHRPKAAVHRAAAAAAIAAFVDRERFAAGALTAYVAAEGRSPPRRCRRRDRCVRRVSKNFVFFVHFVVEP